MSIKTISKATIVALILALALSVCSCAAIKSTVEDIPKATELITDAIEITTRTNPDDAKAKMAELIHPDSDFSIDTILEKAQADEDLAGIDLAELSKDGYSIGNVSDPKIVFNDPELGGNIYEVKVTITMGGESFKVTIDILSNENGMGFYDFDIEK